MKSIIRMAIVFVFLGVMQIYPQMPPPLLHPYNLDFEQVGIGEMPAGWHVPSYTKKLEFSVNITEHKVFEGKYCLELRNPNEIEEGKYGAVMQSIEAKQVRGKKFRFRAAVRMEFESDDATARLWVREHLENNQTGLFEFMEDDPIVSSEWEYYEITGYVDERAEKINFGLLLFGTGAAWIDDASFEFYDESDGDYEGPKKLSDKQAENIAAFTELTGYVRYFYPSFELVNFDWESFSAAGIKVIEKVKTKKGLCDTLQSIFAYVAPGLEICPKKPKAFSERPGNALPYVCLSPWYKGLQDISTKNKLPFNIYQTTRSKHGFVSQYVNAEDFRGKKLRITYAAKAKLRSLSGDPRLFVEVEQESKRKGSYFSSERFTIKNNKWEQYSLDIKVPDDAITIQIIPALIGEGTAWFDDILLNEVNDKEAKVIYEINNPGFEVVMPNRTIVGWKDDEKSLQAGYTVSISDKEVFNGEKCLCIESDSASMVIFPKEGEIISGTLPAGISFSMPFTLYADSVSTLPAPDQSIPIIDFETEGKYDIHGNDRVSRLVILGQVWNIIKHFHTNELRNANMDKTLLELLKRASLDKNQDEFLLTLQLLSAELNDCLSRVWLGFDQYRYTLPFLFKWVNGELLLTDVAPVADAGLFGAKVIEIESLPVNEYFNEKEKYISGALPQWKKLRSLAEFRIGEQDSEVKIKLQTESGEIVDKTFKRNVILSDMAEYRPPAVSIFKSKDADNNDPEKGILYVDLTRLSDDEMKEFLGTMEKAEGYIFDLRGNLRASEHILGYFSKDTMKSVVWRLPNYTRPNAEVESYMTIESIVTPKEPLMKNKAVFLSDERSVGYSELVLSIVKDNKLGVIIGTQSSGSPGEVHPFLLPGSYNFSMTFLDALKSDGSLIYGRGISPDIEVSGKEYYPNTQTDLLVDKAVEMIRAGEAGGTK